ncbi:hypothetical protein I6J14_01605 [Streptococcus dysgalactiae]|uniref:hypothetical protein n=1 Tax=Streptococcus dysgalactiae TaxID=1334 RepID=UPI000E009A18|nr:hypothetical protein [Streptococcus dysgalactiae]QQT04020.1 hypothetical protein I6J14_01605 [Streptococcus dysgalactiae]SUN46147.1 Uncharacterised protein [Streptococcus dysgalactiae subsp. dysgalactiae]SUN50984.1 Uncharacterised protein [Streptococcus dysgalactiae]VDZ39859.1 Uncharacterised protein [Streptococcus dysgalactiae subsp. dysgalactiae]
MSESFDYVAFAKDFEKRHGRPPTAEELEQGIDLWEGIVAFHTPEETQAEIERINASYRPSLWERLKTGLSFVTRNFFRALLILIQSPVYLTLFFFNLIKSAFAVVVMCVVTKGIVGVLLAEFLTWRNINTLMQAPALLRFFAQDFMTNALEPIYFTEIDIIICIILTLFVALVTTFSKTEA